ncbi:hypothetical protein GCM10009720_22090 [Yaniella flava]|uniref:Uncharacterized protein n=1 Tax=Yaniella flava TaxID=287930 RepID=A0ABP5GB80_9MICC|nr:hypothetical protein [Micrococcaceae bacterium]
MYAWIFHILPGPTWFRWILVLAALAAIVFVLMEVVYPWVAEFGFFSDATMNVE